VRLQSKLRPEDAITDSCARTCAHCSHLEAKTPHEVTKQETDVLKLSRSQGCNLPRAKLVEIMQERGRRAREHFRPMLRGGRPVAAALRGDVLVMALSRAPREVVWQPARMRCETILSANSRQEGSIGKVFSDGASAAQGDDQQQSSPLLADCHADGQLPIVLNHFTLGRVELAVGRKKGRVPGHLRSGRISRVLAAPPAGLAVPARTGRPGQPEVMVPVAASSRLGVSD
jgi:hypothetical protein